MPDWLDIMDVIMGIPLALPIVIVAMLFIAAIIKYGIRYIEWLESWTFPKRGESTPEGAGREPRINPHDDEDDGSPPSEDENVFIRSGRIWDIQFQGEDAHVVHNVGMGRLAILLSSPGTPISALSLIERVPASSGTTDPEMLGVSVGDLAKRPVDVADQKTIDDTEMLIKDLEDKMAYSNDIHEKEELAGKISKSKKYLSQITDTEGKPRLTSTDAKKANDAVRESINTAYLKINEVLPDLLEHLDQSLSFGQKLIYSPNPPIKWIVR